MIDAHDHAALTRRAIAAVAGAARLVEQTRASITTAAALVREAAPAVPAREWTPRVRSDAARAVGELEVAGRIADRVAGDIAAAGFNLAAAAGATSDLTRLLPEPGHVAAERPGDVHLIGQATAAMARSASLAEAARSAVDEAAWLVRAAADAFEVENWPRRLRADAAVVGVRAAARGAGDLARGTASASRSLSAATLRIRGLPESADSASRDGPSPGAPHPGGWQQQAGSP